MPLVSIEAVHPYCSTGTVTNWKKSLLILSERSDYHMINNLLIAVHTSARCILTSLLVDEILPPREEKNQNGFRRNRVTTSQILTICRIIEIILAKKSQSNTIVGRFLLNIWFHTERKDGANIASLRSPQRNYFCYKDALKNFEIYDLRNFS